MASKQTKQQLQESLEYCENIVSTIREPLLVLDADLRVISANRSFYRRVLRDITRNRGETHL